MTSPISGSPTSIPGSGSSGRDRSPPTKASPDIMYMEPLAESAQGHHWLPKEQVRNPLATSLADAFLYTSKENLTHACHFRKRPRPSPQRPAIERHPSHGGQDQGGIVQCAPFLAG